MRVFGQIFSHALRKRCDEHPITLPDNFPAFVDEIVHLRFHRTNLDRRIDEPGRPNDLLHKNAAGLLQLPFAGRRRDKRRLRAHRVPFLEAKRAIVDAGRQAEAELRQRGFAPEVAPEHAADLRHCHMAFVGKDERVIGQILEQCRRRLARLAPRQPARVILDAVA